MKRTAMIFVLRLLSAHTKNEQKYGLEKRNK